MFSGVASSLMGDLIVSRSGDGEESLQCHPNCCGDRFIVRCRQPSRSQSLGFARTLQLESRLCATASDLSKR